MIPDPILSDENEIFGNGNGLKERVTACRKRLRLNRIHRVHLDTQFYALLRETGIGAPELSGYSGNRRTVRESLAGRVHARDVEVAQRGEQEVGIT